MEKIYNPKNIEEVIYKNWEKKGYFKPHGNINKESYCIMIPPPNITGNLHIGHAFQQTIIDIIIRYQRMLGKNTLLQVGTDHAGIATQLIIENKINYEEGKNRYHYTRQNFINKIWQWKNDTKNIITEQMRRLGSSIDWDRERFTMDKGLSYAVKKAFITLYKDNLIYIGKRLVNWDPKLCTAISDLEIEHRESKCNIWYIKYLLTNNTKTIKNKNYIIIATTRPETIPADIAIAVHPQDLRYKNLVGKKVIVPLINRTIPIIEDSYVDINKGTGCMKITPAHDFNDYEISKRHCLPIINIFTQKCHIRNKAEIFNNNINYKQIISDEIPIFLHNLERFDARKKIIEKLEALNLLIDIKSYLCTIPYGDRSGTIIEPMLTNQWYLNTKKLAEKAIKIVKEGRIKFIPHKYENIYFTWMNNIQDWCISRQLWWGHRIPVWYDINKNIYVGFNEKSIKKTYKLSESTKLYQDDNVLDTWFSSALWTFSTLGWPKSNNILRTFHPTNVIVSGFDIIFFWIARMIMLTAYLVKDNHNKPQVPFKTVYITGLICDNKGQKMSKSKGNVIDPIDIIDGISLSELLKKRTDNMIKPNLLSLIKDNTKKQFPNGIKSYGADTLRFTLASLNYNEKIISWDMNKLNIFHNLCNKIWNASLFIINNIKDKDLNLKNNNKTLSLVDQWIIIEFNKIIKDIDQSLNNYRFDLIVNILYEFIWNKFCDWYLELSKITMRYGNTLEIINTLHTLINVLESLLRLMHPIIPFLTEYIWQKIKIFLNIQDKTIMLQPFPIYVINENSDSIINDWKFIKKIITLIRSIKALMCIKPNKKLRLLIRNASVDNINIINKNLKFIINLAKLENIIFLSENENIDSINLVRNIGNMDLLIPINNLIDNKEIELLRINKELLSANNNIININKQLNNKNFILNAPKEIIIKVKNKLISFEKIKLKLIEYKNMIVNL